MLLYLQKPCTSFGRDIPSRFLSCFIGYLAFLSGSEDICGEEHRNLDDELPVSPQTVAHSERLKRVLVVHRGWVDGYCQGSKHSSVTPVCRARWAPPERGYGSGDAVRVHPSERTAGNALKSLPEGSSSDSSGGVLAESPLWTGEGELMSREYYADISVHQE